MNLKFWSVAVQLLTAAVGAIEQLIRDKQPTSTTFVSEMTQCRDKLNKMVPKAEALNQDQDRGAAPPESEQTTEQEGRDTTRRG